MESERVYAVLTGDVISSSRINANRENPILAWMGQVEELVKANFSGAIQGDIDVFRGDSWQMVLQEPLSAPRTAVFIRCALLSSAGIDTRIGIGFGRVEYLPARDISTGTGEVYTLSGTGLSQLQKPDRMVFNFPPEVREEQARSLNIILALIDLQVQRWTRKQAEAVSGALVGLTQQEIAESWVADPVTQQAISQHLESAGWSQISRSLQFVENALRDFFRPSA